MKKVLIITVALSALFTLNVFSVNLPNTEAKEAKAANTEAKTSNSQIVSLSSCTLSGTILDTESNETLAGATIIIDGKKYYSDFDGNFHIDALKSGKHKLSVELISYKATQMEVEVSALDKDLVVKLVQK